MSSYSRFRFPRGEMGISGDAVSSVRITFPFSGTIILLSFAVSCCTVAVVIHLDVSRFEETASSSSPGTEVVYIRFHWL
jgi:NADH:ubiquinone oxidoreductase subunit B-like Fe-S oxidoreductase